MRISRQSGAAAVEFALICSLFFTALIGVVEIGRMLWTWNAAVEATRLGARMAVVCEISSSQSTAIRNRMIQRLPALTAGNIAIEYLNPPNAVNTCTTANCKAARVRLTAFTHQTIIPFLPMTVSLPSFSTTLRREYMDTPSNAVCS